MVMIVSQAKHTVLYNLKDAAFLLYKTMPGVRPSVMRRLKRSIESMSGPPPPTSRSPLYKLLTVYRKLGILGLWKTNTTSAT